MSVVIVVVACFALAVSGSGLLPALESEWQNYVARVNAEVVALNRTCGSKRRLESVANAMKVNAEFFTTLTDLYSLLSDDNSEQLDYDDCSLHWTACEWRLGYTSIDELLAHLYRDYSIERDSLHKRAALASVDKLSLPAESTALVIGSGVGGLVHSLSSRENIASVTSTECSKVFMLAQQVALSKRRDFRIAPWVSNFGDTFFGDERDQCSEMEIRFPGGGEKINWLLADVLRPVPSLPLRVFDLVLTSYFVDAAASGSQGFITVLDRVSELVRMGGFWVFVGPLHFHSSDTFPKLSVVEMIDYVCAAHNFGIVDGPTVIDHEDYSRPRGSWLGVNAHAAVLVVLEKLN